MENFSGSGLAVYTVMLLIAFIVILVNVKAKGPNTCNPLNEVDEQEWQ